MKKQMVWGIATLIVLIGIACVFLIMDKDTGPKEVYMTSSKEVIQQSQKTNVPRLDIVLAEEANADNPPPTEPGFKWVWHGDHWHRIPVSQTGGEPAVNTAEYGITRQGKRYKRNPAHADLPVANAVPKGAPLNIDWQDGGHPPPGSSIDWTDPLVWESYRNFWGFEPPKFSPQTGYEYVPTLDNWGTPLQHFDGTFIVTHYKKRSGFRPSPAQLIEYKQLQAQLEIARGSGDNLRVTNLQRDIQTLRSSARGELPIKHTFQGMYYGPPLNDPDKEKALREAGERDLYRRMGIEHLYEFYEKQ